MDLRSSPSLFRWLLTTNQEGRFRFQGLYPPPQSATPTTNPEVDFTHNNRPPLEPSRWISRRNLRVQLCAPNATFSPVPKPATAAARQTVFFSSRAPTLKMCHPIQPESIIHSSDVKTSISYRASQFAIHRSYVETVSTSRHTLYYGMHNFL